MSQNFGKIATALGLFSSCIKSGAAWSLSCEEVGAEAQHALVAIGADQQEIMRINNDLRALLLDVLKDLWDESSKGTLQPKLYTLIDRLDLAVR